MITDVLGPFGVRLRSPLEPLPPRADLGALAEAAAATLAPLDSDTLRILDTLMHALDTDPDPADLRDLAELAVQLGDVDSALDVVGLATVQSGADLFAGELSARASELPDETDVPDEYNSGPVPDVLTNDFSLDRPEPPPEPRPEPPPEPRPEPPPEPPPEPRPDPGDDSAGAVARFLEAARARGDLGRWLGVGDAAAWGSRPFPATFNELHAAFGVRDVTDIRAHLRGTR